MISMNLVSLRKRKRMTQEEVAECIRVSRQAYAKWEKGESVPDMTSCVALADLFEVTVDDLIRHSEKDTGVAIAPKGKYFFGSVTVGERGQIVIPKKAREVFDIEPGDRLIMLGDEEKGIGILPQRSFMDFLNDAAGELFHKKGGGKEKERKTEKESRDE